LLLGDDSGPGHISQFQRMMEQIIETIEIQLLIDILNPPYAELEDKIREFNH
jgi:hypothetical protein